MAGSGVERVVSGGQTGVDRAGLDAALALGIPCGGYCPRGRRAEDGAIPARYPLVETKSRAYPARTERNVRESDGTLILFRRALRGGTALTRALAERHGRPHLAVDLARVAYLEAEAARIRGWISEAGIRVLNVAGPRESEAPGIHEQALTLLRAVLASR